MRKVEIEWFHLDEGKGTCDRCAGTGTELKAVVKELQQECALKDVEIVFRETCVDRKNLGLSNQIYINGRPIEGILADGIVSFTDCPSCSKLIGGSACCRALTVKGVMYETIPRNLIRQAVCRVAECC